MNAASSAAAKNEGQWNSCCAESRMASAAVQESQMATAAVQESWMATAVVQESQMATAAVQVSRMASAAVQESQMATAAVHESQMATAAVQESRMAPTLRNGNCGSKLSRFAHLEKSSSLWKSIPFSMIEYLDDIHIVIWCEFQSSLPLFAQFLKMKFWRYTKSN